MKLEQLTVAVFCLIIVTSSLSAQNTIESRLTIVARGGKFVVSGVLDSERTKEKVVEVLRSTISRDITFDNVLIERRGSIPFLPGWEQNLRAVVRERLAWKDGVLSFPLDTELEKPLAEDLIARTRLRTAGMLQTTPLVDPAKKVTLIFLFASWCYPCRVQASKLNQIYDDRGPEGLDLVGVDTEDEGGKEINDFAKAGNLKFRLGFTTRDFAGRLTSLSKFAGIPQTFLFSDGKITAIFRGGAPDQNKAIEDAVSNLLGH